jgi:glycosyltransferase involved in cell wall biosynthesis
MKPMQQPLVSIFMPCFNQEQYIAAAIDSVLAQDYEHIELVVGDDHSTDGTWAIVQRYEQAHPERVKAARNARNLGITRNCNALLARCTGKYVAFHAGDDLYLPGKLRLQVAAMERAGAVLSYHDVAAFDSTTGETIRHWNSGPESRTPIEGDCAHLARMLIEDGTAFMGALSVMVLRSALPAYGYDERIRIGSDWMLWIDVCAQNSGPVIFVPGTHVRYRRHAESVSMKPMNFFDDEMVVLALAEARYPQHVSAIDKARMRLRYRAATHYLRQGDVRIARGLLLRCLRHREVGWKAGVRLLASLFGSRPARAG